MADEAPSNGNPFDVQTIKHLVALMSRHDLSEIDLRQGEARIRLRRGVTGAVTVAAPPIVPAAMTANGGTTAAIPAAPAAPEKPAKTYHAIKSPGPGLFYNREKPEAPTYVTVGTRVTPTTVVGLMEAMKVYSEILADCSGVIVKALVETGSPVEYGTVLFEVDTTA